MLKLVICSLWLCVSFTMADESCPSMCFCSKDKTSINCDGKHLTSLPPNLPTSVTKLYLRYNDFVEIKTGDFSHLYRLETLMIGNNKITTVGANTFANLSMLTDIDLRNNKMQSVGENAFANLIRLTTLNLLNNLIESINEGAFRGSTNLEFLMLQANSFKAVPALGPLPNLKKLILVSNAITEVAFPASYRDCKQLSYIAMNQNRIKSLTNASFQNLQNNSMTTLSLSVNKISRVEPGAFEPLSSISSLKLGNNPLDSINLKAALEGLHGKSITSLEISHMQLNGVLMKDTFALLKNTTILTLDMKYNIIKTLPDMAFVGLNYLQQLDISNCQIEVTSSQAFFGLDKLTILNMEKNKLTNVPQKLPVSLNILYMDNNQISAIPDKAFMNLGLLKELRIRLNQIQRVEGDAFLSLSSLNKLSLSYNFIASVPRTLFQPTFRLTSLDLSNNNLNNIQLSPGRFATLGSLMYLNLAGNKCSYFQPDFFKDLKSLKYLHLERNWLGNLIAEDYGGVIFMGLTNLEELYLMDNGLYELPAHSFQALNSLKVFNISKNKIKGWTGDLFRVTTKLETFDVSDNLVATVRNENVKNFISMRSWNLTGNPFLCNCDLRWFRDWLNKTSITLANLNRYTCNGPPDWSGKRLLSFDRTKINCEHYTLKIIIISCSIVAVVVIIIGILTYLRRWHIKLCCYKLTRRQRRKKHQAADGRGGYGAIEEARTNYDAYISCAEDDKPWARMHLLPGIDDGKLDDDNAFGGEFKLYFEDRDAIPGEPIVGNIFENMTISRKVIVVLSRNYLTDKMHMFELDLAIDQMYEHNIEEIIVVHIDKGLPDHKFPKYLWKTMKRHQVIEWSADENAKELFTHTLVDRLSVKANAADLDAE